MKNDVCRLQTAQKLPLYFAAEPPKFPEEPLFFAQEPLYFDDEPSHESREFVDLQKNVKFY